MFSFFRISASGSSSERLMLVLLMTHAPQMELHMLTAMKSSDR